MSQDRESRIWWARVHHKKHGFYQKMSFVIVKECEIYDIPRGWNNPQGWDGEFKKILKKQVTGGGICFPWRWLPQ